MFTSLDSQDTSFSMPKVSRRSERELRAAAQSRASAASKRSSGTSHASKRSSLSRSKGLGLSHLMAGSFEERKCYVQTTLRYLHLHYDLFFGKVGHFRHFYLMMITRGF